jgi:hypothetical protein
MSRAHPITRPVTHNYEDMFWLGGKKIRSQREKVTPSPSSFRMKRPMPSGSGSLTMLLGPSNRLAMNIFVLCEHKVFLSMRATPAQLNFFVIIVISLVVYIEWEHIPCN